MKVVERMDAQFAGSPVGFDVAVDRGHRRSLAAACARASFRLRPAVRANAGRRQIASSGFLGHGIDEDPDLVDLDLHRIAGLHEQRRFAAIAPTPDGVPVTMTSPASSVMASLIVAISVATSNTRSSVEASCNTAPLRRV